MHAQFCQLSLLMDLGSVKPFTFSLETLVWAVCFGSLFLCMMLYIPIIFLCKLVKKDVSIDF